MKIKYYLLFAFFSLLFLFYPGDSYYFKIFAHHRELFKISDKKLNIKIAPIPFLKNSYYPEISAEGVYVVDLDSFTPILERNIDNHFFPASTVKIITSLVAVNIYKPEDIITITDPLEDGQVMGLIAGEKITFENLLYGTLIHSGNDAAYALAQNYGMERFIDLMNKKTQELKMKNSVFKNPAGLDQYGQYTSPFDLALAARELLKNTYLAKIVSIKQITISDIDFKYFHQLNNVNKLLGEIQGIGGLKTGYTENALENLVSFYKHEGNQFIIVILKSKNRFEDTKNIVEWINENIDYYSVK